MTTIELYLALGRIVAEGRGDYPVFWQRETLTGQMEDRPLKGVEVKEAAKEVELV